MLVDVEDLSIAPDIKRPPGNRRCGHAVRFGDLLGGVTQNRVVHTERLRIRLIGFLGVGADGKQRGIERVDILAALTERLAFRRSTRAERLHKPNENHRLLATEIGQAVRPAV